VLAILVLVEWHGRCCTTGSRHCTIFSFTFHSYISVHPKLHPSNLHPQRYNTILKMEALLVFYSYYCLRIKKQNAIFVQRKEDLFCLVAV